jgi:methyltransferase (TIGR00027 family)
MHNRPSRTAEWVAFSRTLGRKLPHDARLADDPFGALFAGTAASFFSSVAPAVLTLPLWPAALYMQVRTRAIDDALHAFVAGGGRQVILLGAGYDCRAARFVGELADVRVFEVDHPATQVKKRSILEHHSIRSSARYLPYDFEQRPAEELPSALAQAGHDTALPTLTIWEGVTMYLSDGAVAASVAAVQAYSALGSPFVFTYLTRAELDSPSPFRKAVRRVVNRAGEPFRFGFEPDELPAWLRARGFDLDWDRSISELAAALLPPRHARVLESWAHDQRIALARRAALDPT